MRADVAILLYRPGDGGLDRVAVLLANGFAARGLTTEIWLTETEGAVAHLIAREVRIRRVPSLPFGKRGLRHPLQIPAIAAMIRRHRPAVLMSAGNQSNLVAGVSRLLSGRRDVATILKITNPAVRPQADGWPTRVRLFRFGLATRLSTLTLLLSEAAVAIARAQWPALADKLAFVHNPYVREDAIADGPREAAAIPMLLSIGRLCEQKDQATFLRAIARLGDRHWQAVILGDGPARADLEEEARRLGIAARVRFEGYRPDPAPWLKAAQTLVLSSRWEGFAAVPLEAMAAGCAVATTRCAPGMADLMTRAELPPPVPIGDDEALAGVIARLIDTPPSPVQLVAAARPYAIEAAIDDHLRLLAPWLKRRSATEQG